MSSKTKHNNFSCLACAMKPTIWLGRMTGVTPLTVQCGKRGQPPTFRISWCWILVTLLLLVTMTSILFYLITNNQESDTIHQMEKVLDSLNGMTALMIGIIFLTQLSKRVRAWNDVATFVHRCKSDVPSYVLKDKEGETMFLAIRNMVVLVTLLAIQCGLIGYAARAKSCAELWKFVIYELVSYMVGNTFLITAMDFSANIVLLECSFDVIFERLRLMVDASVTDKYLKTKNFYTIVKTGTVNPRLCDQLLDLRRDYRVVMQAMRLLNESYKYQILIITCLLIFVLVFNVYTLLVVMFGGWKFEYFLELAIFVQSIGAGVYVICLSDSLSGYSDKFSNFLVRTDLSEYDNNELIQVEMFIKEVDANPPLFSAFNIFECRIRIMTTLFSTITTYILVALQFKMQPVALTDKVV